MPSVVYNLQLCAFLVSFGFTALGLMMLHVLCARVCRWTFRANALSANVNGSTVSLSWNGNLQERRRFMLRRDTAAAPAGHPEGTLAVLTADNTTTYMGCRTRKRDVLLQRLCRKRHLLPAAGPLTVSVANSGGGSG